MDNKIKEFIESYYGTAIGNSIQNRRQNLFDNDYDGIKTIYDELEEKGYI